MVRRILQSVQVHFHLSSFTSYVTSYVTFRLLKLGTSHLLPPGSAAIVIVPALLSPSNARFAADIRSANLRFRPRRTRVVLPCAPIVLLSQTGAAAFGWNVKETVAAHGFAPTFSAIGTLCTPLWWLLLLTLFVSRSLILTDRLLSRLVRQ